MKVYKEVLYEVIMGRRSIRRFKDATIEPAVLNRILMAAIHAPSAHNRQPWRMVILRSEDAKQSLAHAMGQELKRARLADGDPLNEIEADVKRSLERITQSPIVVVLSMTMEEMDHYPDDERNQAEYLMAVQSVALAGQNIMLAAHAEGLGSCWMCAPLFSPASVREVLDLPRDWHPQALILLGHPASPDRTPVRKPLEDVVRWM
jgi:F420 biosynthesis protein FbiB-like protein